MTLYRFRESTGRGEALTDNRTGAKLPKRKVGEWVFVGDMDINRTGATLFGASRQDIVDGIARHGYFLLPQLKTSEKDESKKKGS